MLKKNTSLQPGEGTNFYSIDELSKLIIPKVIKNTKELLGINDEDKLIAILRYYKWDFDQLNLYLLSDD